MLEYHTKRVNWYFGKYTFGNAMILEQYLRINSVTVVFKCDPHSLTSWYLNVTPRHKMIIKYTNKWTFFTLSEDHSHKDWSFVRD